MNNSNRLKLQAKEIVSKIPNTPNLEIILLCGSVAQGIADEYSDIELKFVWKNEPSKPERDGILEKLEGEILFKEYFEDYEWYLTILVEGIKIDISHCTLDTIHNISDKVFNNLDTSIDLQAFISSIIDSTVLRGDIDELKNKLGIYPEALSVKCIEVNLIFESWTLRDVLLKRKDYLTLESILIQTILQILRMLFALNKVYLRSHNFKWLKYQVNHLKLKP
ncbi:MAG TPA: hypothetical protein VGA67_03675, partial [Candidatus Dojkabacteria bacterium]